MKCILEKELEITSFNDIVLIFDQILFLQVLQTRSVEIPSCESPTPWNEQTPGTLGEVLRNMPTPIGGTINTTGGNAPLNN